MMCRVRFQPCVYVVAARDYRVKVGISALLPRRLAQLSAAEGEALAVVHRFDFPAIRLAYRVEAEAKRLLREHCIEGEWFSVPRDVAVAVVEQSAHNVVSSADVAAAAGGAARVRRALSNDIAALRAARMMLRWTAADLAAKAGVSLATIKNFERGVTDTRRGTLDAIHGALAAAGVVFMEAGDMRTGGKGVRLKD